MEDEKVKDEVVLQFSLRLQVQPNLNSGNLKFATGDRSFAKRSESALLSAIHLHASFACNRSCTIGGDDKPSIPLEDDFGKQGYP